MTDELEAACERLEQYKSAAAHNLQVAINDTRDQLMKLPYGMPMRTIPVELLRDYRVTSDAYLADRDRRKREAAERALMVDRDFAKSVGFTLSSPTDIQDRYYSLAIDRLWPHGPSVIVRLEFAPSLKGNAALSLRQSGETLFLWGTANRGQLLNLLSALQIPIPQKPEVPCE